VAQTGVNYPGEVLRNAPTIYQAPLTVGNAGGTLTTQSGVPTSLSGPLSVTGTNTTSLNGQVTISGINASYAMSPLGPADVGLKAWAYPPKDALGTGSAVTVTGTTYLTTVHLTPGVTYGTIWLKLQANGGTATAGSNFAGIYNAQGSLKVSTGDISVQLGTTGGTTGYIACPLSSSYTEDALGGLHWVGVQFTYASAGSYPVFYTPSAPLNTVTAGAGNGVSGVAGPNGAAPFPYSAVAGTTVAAGLIPPTFPIGSAGTTAAYVYWAALS